ncbi:multidrug efflux SMR transporter [Metabacillus litoralis]|uniref:DMT family transporter n=1 Tax=Metabacillus litoralis TaxID=152268 RepID=UPI00299F0309|nr:multidrug efflux SMR transporter [Metabacillus litoralis]
MKGILYLMIAVLSEVFGSTMLKLSNGFTNFIPSIGVVVGFLLAFLSLSFSLKTIPLSSAYATWSGLGTALTALIGVLLFQESFTFIKLLGLCLVILGIYLLNTSSQTLEDQQIKMSE